MDNTAIGANEKLTLGEKLPDKTPQFLAARPSPMCWLHITPQKSQISAFYFSRRTCWPWVDYPFRRLLDCAVEADGSFSHFPWQDSIVAPG